jgi:hypothetical protein
LLQINAAEMVALRRLLAAPGLFTEVRSALVDEES